VKGVEAFRLVEIDSEARGVVLDVNVWLDVAEMIGPGATPEHRRLVEDRLADPGIREKYGRLGDSFDVWRIAASGRFAGHLPLRTIVSTSLLEVLDRKLRQPSRALDSRDQGFDWQSEDVEDFLADAVLSVAEPLSADVDARMAPVLNPPLDHEDGMILATALAGEARYLVTRDGQFRAEVSRSDYSPTRLEVMSPREFKRRVLRWRRRVG
jgi:predicted nucleic acid-binding protein